MVDGWKAEEKVRADGWCAWAGWEKIVYWEMRESTDEIRAWTCDNDFMMCQRHDE